MRTIPLLFLIGLICINPYSLSAQGTDVVRGEVRDAVTGETLPGATLLIVGTFIGVSTDVDGRFVLRRAPLEEFILQVSYMGYQTFLLTVGPRADERSQILINLVADTIIGDEILVQAFQRGQARALTEQREAPNIKSVISAEQIERFADQTVDGALSRVAGMGHGGANIRGVGAAMSKVTMDGQRMGSTGVGERTIDLSTISADVVQQLEVIKVIKPNMDADALSGVININTRRAIGSERSLSVNVGGGTTLRFSPMIDTNSRLSLSFGDSPRSDFSYGLNFSYQNTTGTRESVDTEWETRNFGDGPRDVLSVLRNELQLTPQQRYATGIQMTFQPTSLTTFHVQGMVNVSNTNRENYGLQYNPALTSYVSPNMTEGSPGRILYSGQYVPRNLHQYTFRTSVRHLFEKFDIEYGLGWGHGRSTTDNYRLLFRSPNSFHFVTDISDRSNPTIDVANWGFLRSFPTAAQLPKDVMDHRWSSSINNEIRANFDITIPNASGSIQLGSSALLTFQNGHSERYYRTFRQSLNLSQFPSLNNTNWQVFGRNDQTYNIPWILDFPKVVDWYNTMLPLFDIDMGLWASESETSKYIANEHVFGLYSMGNINYRKLRILIGARYEYTDAFYQGKDGSLSETGRFLGSNSISRKNQYGNLFPNAQFTYSITRFTNIRLAYSRSIGRPSFDQLNPFVIRRYNTEVITMGNPDLRPMLSNNLDFLVEHYFMNVGQISVGVYYKMISDFVFRYDEIIGQDGLDGSGSYIGWRRISFRNGDEATVYGLEVAWQQNLEFLPGILSNLGTYANYSFSESISDIGRRNSNSETLYVRLQDQRPHVVNIGLDYSTRGFSAQVTYQWATPSITAYGNLRWVPEIQLRDRVYFDTYRSSTSDLSFSARYRVTRNLRLWMDATNLLNSKNISYRYNQLYYPVSAERNGVNLNVGLRYSF